MKMHNHAQHFSENIPYIVTQENIKKIQKIITKYMKTHKYYMKS